MARKTTGRRILALVLVLVMCVGTLRITAYAAPGDYRSNWSYAYYLGQEYLGNAPGVNPKPDPVGYGFQGVITSVTFLDDAEVQWTFHWNYEANGEWRITGSNATREKATAWPQVTSGKTYVGYCGNTAYIFTLSADGSAKDWTYVNEDRNHANWFYYIRFIREYTVNVFYQNETGTVTYNGVTYAAQEPLIRYFHFLYPNGNIIDDSEYEDGEYTDPITLLPQDYLSEELLAQGYELKYATDAQGNDVMGTGVTISLLGENILNVYCTLIPPKTENYTVVHAYYTEGTFDGKVDGQTLEVEKDSDFAQIVAGIEKLPVYEGNTYGYTGYAVDPGAKVITLTYVRQLPVYDYTLIYNANFGTDPDTVADGENITGTYAQSHTFGVDENGFVRENYVFAGWNTEPDGSGNAYAPGAELTLTADHNSQVLYAQWVELPKYDYALIYNANFGTDPDTVADSENITGTYAQSHTFGVDENGFVRENYVFAGWNTEPDGTGNAYAPGAELTLTAGHNSQVLYAQWVEFPKYNYVVVYNANFGQQPEIQEDLENLYGTYATEYTIGVDGNPFVREHYVFVGWSTSPDGSVNYQPEDKISFTEGGVMTLYAQWELREYDYTVVYLVQVDEGGYSLFTGVLPEGAPVSGSGAYGQQIDGTVLEVPALLEDAMYAYSFTALQGVVITAGENVVYVYYDYDTPDPQEEPDPTEPPGDEPDPTEPPGEEPDPTEPPGEEHDPTEPPGEEPDPTEPPGEEPDPTEPPGEEPDPTEPPGEEPDPTEPSDGGDPSALADVPKTGDPLMFYVGVTALSGMGLLGLGLTKKKEEE